MRKAITASTRGGLGLAMVHLGLAPMCQFQVYQWHKSVGITLVLLTALRVGWRLAHIFFEADWNTLPVHPTLNSILSRGPHPALQHHNGLG